MFYDEMEIDIELPSREDIIEEMFPVKDDFAELFGCETNKRTPAYRLLAFVERYAALMVEWTSLKASRLDIELEYLMYHKMGIIKNEIDLVVKSSEIKG